MSTNENSLQTNPKMELSQCDQLYDKKIQIKEDKELIKANTEGNCCQKNEAKTIENSNCMEIEISDEILKMETQNENVAGHVDFNNENQNFKMDTSVTSEFKSIVGIFNNGNTCYMNSILQTLFHIAIIRKLILNTYEYIKREIS